MSDASTPARVAVFTRAVGYRHESIEAGVAALDVVDESSYTGGTMGAGGCSFYTGLGHPAEGFDEPLYRAHLGGGIRYALGRE